jgi:hypothetical protein
MLRQALQQSAQAFTDHQIGWQGGSVKRTVYWLPRHGIWSVLEGSPPGGKKGPGRRFWNCFGVDNPASRNMLRITVEINPPHEGDDPRVAGLFVRDERNRVYIAHTGKVGGGREGIGQSGLRRFLADGDWREIQTQRGRQTALAFGPIDAPEFVGQLADFVGKIADFKERAPRTSAIGS